MSAFQVPVAGYSGLIEVGTAYNNLKVLGFCKDQTITFNAEPLDVTNYQSLGWMENIVGLRSWEVSVEALYVDGDEGLNILRNNSLSLLPVAYPPPLYYWAFYPISQGIAPIGTTYYTGTGVLASFELADPVDDAVTITFSITGSGPLHAQTTTSAAPAFTAPQIIPNVNDIE
jgi:predicted secreted protein